MTLAKYIHDLLYRYECVIIPDFGGLLTKTESARIDEETHTFHPPTKRLGFNSQLTENDGLLANHIASVDKIPYETALNFIKFEVLEWKSKLENENITLDNIGEFSLNSEGVIVFEPDPNSNFLTDAFGLSTITTHTVSRDEETEKEIEFDSLSDIVSEDEIYVNDDVRREISPFFKYAAAIVILLGIIGLFTKQIFNLNKQEKQINELADEQEAKITKRIQEATFEISSKLPDVTIKVKNEDALIANDDSTFVNNDDSELNAMNTNDRPRVVLKKDRVEKALAKKTETNNSIEDSTSNETVTNDEPIATTDSDNSKKPEPVVENKVDHQNNTNYKYHIIAGAFKDPSNATKKVNQLKARGFNATIVGINKWQLTQVAFGSYATKEEAQATLREIKKNVAKDAWLLVK